MSWSLATPGRFRLLLPSRVAVKGAPAAPGVGALSLGASLGVKTSWHTRVRGHGVS